MKKLELDIHSIGKMLIEFIREEVNKAGFNRAVIGLRGDYRS
ncbi:MAG: hypothetical protein QGH40_02820 [bacterium]|jgi:NH3-dependent NAD+ synthetase|nr:hypothetical protein [bacterium]